MGQIRKALGDEAYSSWIAPLTLEDYDAEQNRLTVAVPNEFYKRWIQKRYLPHMSSAFNHAMGDSVQLEMVVREGDSLRPQASPVPEASQEDFLAPLTESDDSLQIEAFQAVGRGVSPATPTPATVRRGRFDTPAPVQPVGAPRLNPRYIFDDFIVGESNRYAHAAAVAVAEPKGGRAFNPLFIYGGSGLGKTHLMQAIGHKLWQADQRLRVLYVTSEQFINGFIDSIQSKRPMEFRNAYRNVDLLLIDDVQFLTGKERTQTEFFHTFNALYDAGKRIVVTSDRPPKDLATLEDRLRSRFEWGLLVDIQPPDLETRIAILRKKAEQEGVRLPNDVILFIAERVTQNIREMEGTLKRLRMASSLHNRTIDLETARDVLGHLNLGAPQPRVSVDDVQRAVCAYFGIRPNDLLGKNRSKKFSQPRHLAQYLCRKLTNLSFPDIAQKFGGKDHTSIIYACRKVESAISKDSNMSNVVAHLTKQVTKGSDQ
ncbi:chromosomal replication initiator protein DnaA [Candidatus Sumerlaeota bacterium]|nr:chromosomal replication initiator protein DnaA [Candidatus Sumerlaeota bacterium]